MRFDLTSFIQTPISGLKTKTTTFSPKEYLPTPSFIYLFGKFLTEFSNNYPHTHRKIME